MWWVCHCVWVRDTWGTQASRVFSGEEAGRGTCGKEGGLWLGQAVYV